MIDLEKWEKDTIDKQAKTVFTVVVGTLLLYITMAAVGIWATIKVVLWLTS